MKRYYSVHYVASNGISLTYGEQTKIVDGFLNRKSTVDSIKKLSNFEWVIITNVIKMGKLEFREYTRE